MAVWGEFDSILCDLDGSVQILEISKSFKSTKERVSEVIESCAMMTVTKWLKFE
jgi:hypothetical protein